MPRDAAGMRGVVKRGLRGRAHPQSRERAAAHRSAQCADGDAPAILEEECGLMLTERRRGRITNELDQAQVVISGHTSAITRVAAFQVHATPTHVAASSIHCQRSLLCGDADAKVFLNCICRVMEERTAHHDEPKQRVREHAVAESRTAPARARSCSRKARVQRRTPT